MNRFAQFLRVAKVRVAPPAPSTLQLEQEANDWVTVLRNPGCRERPELNAWVRQSPEHLRAFREAWELDELLRHMGPDPLRTAAAIAQAYAP